MRSRMIFLCAAMVLSAFEARAQQQGQEKDSGREPQAQGRLSTQREETRPAREAGDLTADNLDRVAATAEQILGILERDAGLMVEFQRMLAQYASASGQLLEESDLTDSAVAERLREDLRTRVLATRLLQRYGYLVPKVNPDSDLAQEQKLFLQERAQQLARTRERNDAGRSPAPDELTAACDSQQQTDCDSQDSSQRRARTLSEPRGREGLPADQIPGREGYPSQPARPDGWNSPQVLRTEFAEPGATESISASSSPRTNNSVGNVSAPGRSVGGIGGEGLSQQGLSGNEFLRNGNAAEERAVNAGGGRSGANEFERRSGGGERGTKLRRSSNRCVWCIVPIPMRMRRHCTTYMCRPAGRRRAQHDLEWRYSATAR